MMIKQIGFGFQIIFLTLFINSSVSSLLHKQNDKVVVYDDSLNSQFIISATQPFNSASSKNKSAGNYSIEFTNSFYIFAKSDNLTFDKSIYKQLSFDILTTSDQQDFTLSLITSTKAEHSLPIINQINPFNSFLKLPTIPPNNWTHIKIDLEYFPTKDYRGLWFLQKHPNNSIFIDNIELEEQSEKSQGRDIQILYQDGMVGYGVIVHDANGVDLNYKKGKNQFENHSSCIQFDLKLNNQLYFQFPSNLKSNNTELKFKILWSKGKYKPILQVSFNPLFQLEDTSKYYFQNEEEKGYQEITINIPTSTFLGFFLTKKNVTDDKEYKVYIDNVRLEFDNVKLVETKPLHMIKKPPLLPVQPGQQPLDQVIDQQPLIIPVQNIPLTLPLRVDHVLSSPLNPSPNEKSILELDNSINLLERDVNSRYFPFTKVRLPYITSTNGAQQDWIPDFPSITLKSTSSRVAAYGTMVQFNNSRLADIIGRGPLEVLFQNETTKNEFQFLNLNFTFPTNRFYLIVGSVDAFEDIWVSTTLYNFPDQYKWTLVDSGFLNDAMDNSTSQLIKYKFAKQGLYLSARKSESDLTPPRNNPNYIVLKPIDPVTTISFSMVSSVDYSRVFYSLFAIDELNTFLHPPQNITIIPK